MNDTSTPPPDTDHGVRGESLRTIVDMKRSRDDRLLGGVCAGAAKHLNIDPVVVRVIVAVLTLVGFAGVILYLAAWFLLPAEDADRSVAADWFHLDKNEEQVRTVGLVAAGVLAVLAIVGDNGWAGWGAPFVLFPIALIYYVFVVRPQRRRAPNRAADGATSAVAPVRTEFATTEAGDFAGPPHLPPPLPVQPRERKSRALVGLTLSTMVVVLASMRIWADFNDPINWLTYVAVALGMIGVALVVGTFYGHGGWLIALGALLAVTLAIGSVFPTGRIGEQKIEQPVAAQIGPHYTHGIGHLVLDLTTVSDPEQLLGRTVELDMGVGQTQVFVPEGLNVTIESHLKAGETNIFDRRSEGTNFELNVPGTEGEPVFTVVIEQKIGNIEVIRK